MTGEVESTTMLLDGAGMAAALERLAIDAIERGWVDDSAAVIGIQRRGAVLSRRLVDLLEARTGRDIDHGVLDITLYRDDLSSLGPHPLVNRTEVSFDVTGRTLLLVDDVIYTGRTARAALDVICSMGRPSRVLLLALIDRGGREYPIEPSAIGRRVEARADQIVHVMVREYDEAEGVGIVARPAPSPAAKEKS